MDTAQTPLFTGDYKPTGEEWAQIAVAGTIWLVLPLALGIVARCCGSSSSSAQSADGAGPVPTGVSRDISLHRRGRRSTGWSRVELRKSYDTRAGFWLLLTIGLLVLAAEIIVLAVTTGPGRADELRRLRRAAAFLTSFLLPGARDHAASPPSGASAARW